MSKSNGNMLVYAAIVIAIIALGYGLISSGPEGPQGLQGPPGPAGPQGPQGEPGEGIEESELATQIEEQISERLAFDITASKEPLRGCPSCHALVDPDSGRYTLSYEAHERAEARRGEDTHPNTAPDGTDITATSEAGLETCLQCARARVSLYINDDKSLVGGDASKGEILYENTCVFCHGVDGKAQPEALGELAKDNPWEVMHKIRFGQPGIGMPAAVDNNWSINEVVDLLKYLQTLSLE
jgi:mono/diheme cytochrome c family protein